MIDCFFIFFFQAEDGIRDLVRSRGLGDVYKRQGDISMDSFFFYRNSEQATKSATGKLNAMTVTVQPLSLIHI